MINYVYFLMNIENSKNILLIITEALFKRKFVIQELTTGLKYNKNIILIWDKGRCPELPKKDKIPIICHPS